MDVNSNIPLKVKQQSGFWWPKEGIKYLGIYIPLSLDKLFDANDGKILNTIWNDLDRWSALPITFLGRIELYDRSHAAAIFISNVANSSSQIHV